MREGVRGVEVACDDLRQRDVQRREVEETVGVAAVDGRVVDRASRMVAADDIRSFEETYDPAYEPEPEPGPGNDDGNG